MPGKTQTWTENNSRPRWQTCEAGCTRCVCPRGVNKVVNGQVEQPLLSGYTGWI